MNYTQEKALLIGVGGKSGKAVLEFFVQRNRPLFCLDEKPWQEIDSYVRDLILKVDPENGRLLGRSLRESALAGEVSPELVIISPGVPRSLSLIRHWLNQSVPIISEIEFAYSLGGSSPVAFTGTDGKSTTTAWAAQILKDLGYSAIACGNIGLPYLEVVSRQQEGEATLPIVELSSYQLESIHTFAPQVAALLNISEDHVDRYDAMGDYISAKLNIFDRAVYGLLRYEDYQKWPVIRQYFDESRQRLALRYYSDWRGLTAEDKEWLGAFGYKGNDLVIHIEDREWSIIDLLAFSPLAGEHNKENLAFAVVAAFLLCSDKEACCDHLPKAAQNFGGLAHRFEYLGTWSGVRFVNDSKATTFQSAAQAVFSCAPDKVIWLAGGRAKGGDIQNLAREISGHIKAAVVIGETAPLLQAACGRERPNLACHTASSIADAVAQAWRMAEPGDTILFSPAFASFDMFDNFEHRGDSFRQEVEALLSE